MLPLRILKNHTIGKSFATCDASSGFTLGVTWKECILLLFSLGVNNNGQTHEASLSYDSNSGQ